MKLDVAKIRKVFVSTLLILSSVIFLYTGGFGAFSAMTQRALLMALLSPVAFLGLKKKNETKAESIFNFALALVILAINIYVIFVWKDRAFMAGETPKLDIILGSIMVFLVLEATRRTNGLFLTLTAAVFILYALFGPYLPTFIAHRGESWPRLVNFLFMTTEGFYGIPMDIAATYIIIFIIFGAFLQVFEGGQWFIDMAYAITGRFRGGPAKTAILGSALMGMISGSPAANVVTTGTFSIPLMKKVGYKPQEAGAIEAVASTGGMFTPPIMGAAAFIMAQYLEVPYLAVCVAAIVPALLYYFALMFVADARAVKNNISGLPKEELPSLVKVMKERGHLGIPLIFLIAAIVSGWSPTRSAFWATILTVAAAFLSKLTRPTRQKIIEALKAGSEQAVQIVITCAAAGIIVGTFLITGLGAKLSYTLIAFSQGNLYLAALCSAIIAILLGCAMPPTAVYIILVTILVPVLTKLGASPISAHMFIFMFSCLGAITPPVAIAAYCGAAIAKAEPNKTGWLAFRFGLPAYIIPFMFIGVPAIILQGTLPEILQAVATETIGVLCLVAAMEGFVFIKWNSVSRVLLGMASILLLVPETITDLIGSGLIVAAILVNIIFIKKIINWKAFKGAKT
ncbi:MAG: TRAP transporter fused permease subunit [Firmicutes bacterium]|nr:TRAP transporter fused permease subunit [Bacillota bacterium]